MIFKKYGLTTLGLFFLAALSLTLMTARAQANWLVEGKAPETIKVVTASDHAPIIFTVQKKNIEIKCAEISSSNVKPGTTVEGEAEFKSCVSISPIGSGKINTNCKPTEPVKVSFKAKVFAHNSRNYLLFEPKTTGGKFTTISLSELCSLSESADVTGSITSECGHLNEKAFEGFGCSVEEPSVLLQPNEALFTEDGLKFGISQATLSGIASLAAKEIEVQEEGKELTENQSVVPAAFSSLALALPKNNFEVKCSTLSGEGVTLLAKSSIGEGNVKFSGCATFSPIGSGIEYANCKPVEPIIASGKGEILLHGGQNYILITQPKGTLATVKFTGLCSLETLNVAGSLILECGDLKPVGTWEFLDCANPEVDHLVRSASFSLFPSNPLVVGAKEATLLGDASVKLGAPLSGKTWSGRI